MEEFRLPDAFPDLQAAEEQLRGTLRQREAEFQIVQRNYPPNCDARKTPAYLDMLVAHRRWQFAYEKLLVLRGRIARA